MPADLHIALTGNPNSGKSSLFNALTGLNQKVGNFPGVTVEKHTGESKLPGGSAVTVIDLPGTYSLYPRRGDEWVAYRVLMGADAGLVPDMLVCIVDASNLKRNLLFATQIIDLKIPVIIALTMTDLARKQGTEIDVPGLERELGVRIITVNPRKGKGITALKKAIEETADLPIKISSRNFSDDYLRDNPLINRLRSTMAGYSDYQILHYAINNEHLSDEQSFAAISKAKEDNAFNATKFQAEEIVNRFAKIKAIMQSTVAEADPLKRTLITERIDNILLHRVWGYAILLLVLFLMFQSVYWIAGFPQAAIEYGFGGLSAWLKDVMSPSLLRDLFINGFIAGLSGIIVFVPQIMILFGLITLLEDTGYMARISFLSDKLMRKSGLNGKSVMPMISGYACAVPAIMSARNIENSKERLLTILVTPLMSCSARLPVYTILIGLVIPQQFYLGFISLHGLVMMALYLFGTVLALVVARVFKWFIKSAEKSFFILELPVYHAPRWKNIGITMVQKARIFVFNAGKIILLISLVLWALGSFGPAKQMNDVRQKYASERKAAGAGISKEAATEIDRNEKSELLKTSWAGQLGSLIEPAIKPLGYDWKIGIALITSFAAREVFVGTMATLYAAEEDADENSLMLREKMSAARWSDGTKVYTLATGMSLLMFYLIAMQCMSTLAIVKRETGTWKWPLIQFAYMTVLAYVLSWVTYNIFN